MIAVIWSAENIFRVVVTLLACALVGTNLAFIIHTPKIFPHEATLVWRLFFFGKSLITSSAAYVLWEKTAANESLTGVTFLLLTGIILSNASLWLLYRHRTTHIVIPD